MKKNVKGFIGLFAGIASFVLIALSLALVTNPIEGTNLALHGTVNVVLAFVAAFLGLIAIIFGAMSTKEKDASGPRKAGIIIGIFAIIIALCAAGICALTKSFVDYANGKPDTLFSQLDESQRKDLDQKLQELRAEAAK